MISQSSSSRVPILSILATLASLSLLIETVHSQETIQRYLEPALVISPSNSDEIILRPVKRMSEDDEECKLKKESSPILTHVLEEVCLLCNELYSHVEANVRARCRANCFKNPMVGKCMARFAPRDVMDPDNFEF